MLDLFSEAGKMDRARHRPVCSNEQRNVLGNKEVSVRVLCCMKDLTAFRTGDGPDNFDTRRPISLVNVLS
jgi:hypothetical protein